MIHILTPTNRWMNLPYLFMNLSKVGFSENFDNLRWHLLLSAEDYVDWKELIDSFPYWVDAIECPNIPYRYDPCYFKLNHYLTTENLSDSDWYGCVADDNMLSEGVFNMLRECEPDTEIAIFSELRGTEKLDVNPLVLLAQKGTVGVYKTDLCQFFVKGSVYKEFIFNPTVSYADGELIKVFADVYKTQYFPHHYVYFNVLQPGRWSYRVTKTLFS